MKSLVALVIAIALAWGTTQWIYAGVETAASQHREPLPVAVVHFDVEDHYARHSSYVGTIKAGRDSTIGFEVGGTLATMPAKEGMQVGADSIIATLDIDRRLAQLRAAEAELERINADLELAKRKRERFEDLVDRGLTSRQQFDEVQLGEQALAQARMASRARRDSAALDVEKSTLRAPFPGVVAQRFAQEGTVVTAGTPVLRLLEQSGFEAHIGVPTPVGGRLTPGNFYSLRLGDQRYEAQLRGVRTDVDPTTLTVGAVFVLPPTAAPMAGETVLLELEEAVNQRGGWLPISALTAGNRGLWDVLVVKTEGNASVAARESVEILYTRQERVYVRGTLADQALVIAGGLQRLTPGAAIKPVDS